MSASASKTKEKSTQTQTNTGTATTTPNTPDWLAQPWQRYGADVAALQGSGPLIAGAQGLQNQAFGGAAGLGKFGNGDGRQVNGGGGDGYAGGGNGFDLAQSLGLRAANAGANTAGAVGPAQTQGYEAPRLGPAAQATAGTIPSLDLNGYINPYTDYVQGAFTSDFDANAGRQRALQAAEMAQSGGARNSNNSITEALTEGEFSRARGAGVAGIRSDAFNRATDLASRDLDRGAGVSQFNAGQQNQFSLQDALAIQGARQFGAESANRAAFDYVGRQDQNSQFNAGQQDSALQRLLSGAGLVSGNATARGNMDLAQGANDRANIGLQADLGAQQRDIANSQSPAATQALIAQLLGYLPNDLFVGQTVNENRTGTGTGTSEGASSSNPGLMGILGAAGTVGMGLGQMGWRPFGR